MLDVGIYPITFARFLAGDPVEAKVIGTLGDTGVDATVGGVVSYSSGALGVFHTSLDMATQPAAPRCTAPWVASTSTHRSGSRSGFTVRIAGEEPVHVEHAQPRPRPRGSSTPWSGSATATARAM